MILKAIIDDKELSLNVPDAVIAQGKEFFAKLEVDMNRGRQMSREWVRNPSPVERCQIVADKLPTAIEKENEKLGTLMAGYILGRMPGIDTMEIDVGGEIQNTQFLSSEQASAVPPPVVQPQNSGPRGLGKLEAMEQARNDVTKVFKVGRTCRFSVFDHTTGSWQDSPTIAAEQEAEHLRQETFKERFEALQRVS